LESITATDFTFGVKILTSSCYTRKILSAMPTSGLVGRARESIMFKNRHFVLHFGSSPLGTGGLL